MLMLYIHLYRNKEGITDERTGQEAINATSGYQQGDRSEGTH